MKSISASILALLKRRIVTYLILPLAVVGGLALSVKPVFMRLLIDEFYFPAPVYHYQKPRSHAEAMRQDLDYLDKFPELDRSFDAKSRAEFHAGVAALEARADTLTVADLAMQASRLLALADNGHTNVRAPDRAIVLNRVPLRFGWFAEGLFVVRAETTSASLLGAQVQSIDGVPVVELLQKLRPYTGGNFERLRAYSPFMFESPDALHAVDGTWPQDRLVLDVVLRDGHETRTEVAALPPEPKSTDTWSERELAPAPTGYPGTWKTVLADDDTQPWVLRDPDHSVFYRSLDDGHGLYLHLWAISDDKRGSLSSQLQAILDGLKPASLDYAVVDLRMDGGGNYLTAAAFAKRLPNYLKPTGKLYILTDNFTFSAAIVTLAWLRYYGGAHSVIVGEHAGDREEFWAEGSGFELPNSQLWMAFRTGYHDWEHGCYTWSRCFWPNVFYSVPAGKLGPDVTVAWRFSDYAAGRDTVLDYVEQTEAAAPKTGPLTPRQTM
ncbi:MAG TPA: hypothetical protein VFK21_02530 [Gammaproteobacteria bacterium]|nr:hypothetical protein [Gammaproteobacteria bacterium]